MTDADITQIYSAPIQGGGELPYFVGKQYGNGWLRTLGRFAFPILRRILNIAMNTGQDVVDGRKEFKQSLFDNAKKEIPRAFFRGSGATAAAARGTRKRPINRVADDIPGSIFTTVRKTRRIQ